MKSRHLVRGVRKGWNGTLSCVRADADRLATGTNSRALLSRRALLLGVVALVALGGMTADHAETMIGAARPALIAERPTSDGAGAGAGTASVSAAIEWTTEGERLIDPGTLTAGDLVMLTCSAFAVLLVLFRAAAPQPAGGPRRHVALGGDAHRAPQQEVILTSWRGPIALRVIRR